jgi:hypothetical protein
VFRKGGTLVVPYVSFRFSHYTGSHQFGPSFQVGKDLPRRGLVTAPGGYRPNYPRRVAIFRGIGFGLDQEPVTPVFSDRQSRLTRFPATCPATSWRRWA